MSQIIDIRRDLITFLKDFTPYYEVAYDSDRLPYLRLEGGNPVHRAPASVEANEISSEYAEARNHGRELLDQRVGWQIEALVAWSQEIVLEDLEEDLARPMRITAAGDSRTVLVRYRGAAIEHPVRGKSPHGTFATLRFDATLWRP